MNVDEFFEKANRLQKGEGISVMQAFGEVEQTTDDFEESLDEPVGVDNDFEEDLDEPVGVDNDFEEDFEEDFTQIESSSVVQEKATAWDLGLDNVTIVPKKKSDDKSPLKKEIIEFIERHGGRCTEEDTLFNAWNELYGDSTNSDEECILKYLKVVRNLWFDSSVTLAMAVNEGTEFLNCLKFSRRLCQKGDVQFIQGVWNEPWYNADVIDRFSNAVNFDPLLFELMKAEKVDTELLDKFVDNSTNLMCCIRLLLADKFIYSEFVVSIQEDRVSGYTESMLLSDRDRFACIRHRTDFNEVVELITKLENNGLIVSEEILEKYCNAFYLPVIIKSAAHGVYNQDFITQYLENDLGALDFISRIYERNEIDLSLAEDGFNFFEAKIKTDARECRLRVENFKSAPNAYRVLVCSRYAGELSEIDYRRFLAAIVYSSDDVLGILGSVTELISSFNTFWMNRLLQMTKLDEKMIVSDDVGENILFIYYADAENKKKFYLQIDTFALDSKSFLNRMNDVFDVAPLDGNKGIVISNSVISVIPHWHHNFTLDGSLTAWAKGNVDLDVMNQFSNFQPAVHANLLRAIDTADKKFKAERERVGADIEDPQYQVSASVLEFLKMDVFKYSNYDKMFAFLAESSVFIHLLRSKNARSYLMLFSNAFLYDTNAKMVYMFLYCIFRKYHGDRFSLLSTDVSSIDNKSVIFLKGLNSNQVCYNIKTLISSIDSLVVLAKESRSITLEIISGTIQLNL